MFEAAFAVRQIEIGFASLAGVFFGLTVILYGVALLLSPVGPNWLDAFGLVSGGATLSSGIVQAYTGFSDIAMSVSMPSMLLTLVWSVCMGLLLLLHRSSVAMKLT